MSLFPKTIIFFLLTFSSGYLLRAQQGSQGNTGNTGAPEYKVSGKVIDNTTGIAIEYASIGIFRSRDSALITGGITDKKGEFSIAVSPGKYHIRTSFIGFNDKYSETFTLTPKTPIKDLGNISLKNTTVGLDAVEIVAEKRMVEYALDKKVVNVDQNIVNEGGNALDVLQNAPSINVDAEGNVSMKGSSNVTILIDGRPASLSGVSIEQLPANVIESVEIISNPSAKYNPEGMSGIINIKTKKNALEGINGLASISASTANRYNGSLNLNYGYKDFNFFAAISARKFERITHRTTETFGRYEIPNAADSLRYEYGPRDDDRDGWGGNIKLGFDYKINRFNTVSLSGTGNIFNFDMSTTGPGTNSYTYNDFNNLNWYQQVINSSSQNRNTNGYGIIGNYTHTTTRPREEFTIDMSYGKNFIASDQDIFRVIQKITDTTESPQVNNTSGDNYDFDAQLNYLFPLREKGKIEFGYQGKMRGSESDEKQYVFDSIGNRVFDINLSDNFTSTEQTHGVYATWGDEFGKFSMQIGGRLEYASMDGETTTPEGSINNDTSFNYEYIRFYPTIHLSQKIAKNQDLQLSFSRRVNRPNPRSLNPFVDYSNYPLSLQYGNPELLPEDVFSLELNHAIIFKKTSFHTTLYYRKINDVIRRYSFDEVDALGNIVKHSTFLNYKSGTNYGMDLIWEQELLKWWRINVNGSFYRNITEGGLDDETLNSDAYSYSFKFNSTMTFPKSLVLQVSAQYRGPQYEGQTETQPAFTAEIAMRKSFFNNRLSVGLRLSDIFNTQEYNNTTTGEGFKSIMTQYNENSRALYLTASYKINAGAKKEKRPHNNVSTEEDFN